jgi:GT2 family glycosyltransferase
MDLSVVIVNWNTRDLLRDCLGSVLKAGTGIRMEVLVADNASSDGSQAMVLSRFPTVRLIESPVNLGFAGGNNLALRQAQGRHVLLLNSDTLLVGDVLREAVDWLDTHPRAGVMGPLVRNADGSPQASCSAWPSLGNLALQLVGITRVARWDSYRLTGWDRSTARRVDVVSGAAMFVRRAAMEEVGLLDESFFFFGEETDWCRRFARAGWEVVFVPLASVTHFGGGSVGRLNHRRDVMLTEGTTRLHRKHGGLPAGLACFALLAAHNLSRALFWAIPAVFGRGGARTRATHFARVVANLPEAWPRSRREPAG